MSKFDVCPFCGATLDHGETCDCVCGINIEETTQACTCQAGEKTE
ncbi:hypothetical protein [Anaerotignum sp.]|nr:hypothetical protein [Anaerotignum sp.]